MLVSHVLFLFYTTFEFSVTTIKFSGIICTISILYKIASKLWLAITIFETENTDWRLPFVIRQLLFWSRLAAVDHDGEGSREIWAKGLRISNWIIWTWNIHFHSDEFQPCRGIPHTFYKAKETLRICVMHLWSLDSFNGPSFSFIIWHL